MRHCADSPTGLPLGPRIPPADFDKIVYQATNPGDHYLLENGFLNVRVNHPVSQVYASWFVFPDNADVTQDWIYQRYFELVKLRLALFIESTYGDQAKMQGLQAQIVPLQSALISDNADPSAES